MSEQCCEDDLMDKATEKEMPRPPDSPLEVLDWNGETARDQWIGRSRHPLQWFGSSRKKKTQKLWVGLAEGNSFEGIQGGQQISIYEWQ